MKKLLFTTLLAAGIVAANAQDRTYQDNEGDYHYETKDQQVWIPEQRVGGIFGVGGRVIPGHYETRREQVKVYNNNHQTFGGEKGWRGKHPHGMPPGQRKKLQNNNGNWSNPGTWIDNGKGGKKKNKR